MSTWRTLRRADDGQVLLKRLRLCAGFWCKLLGLMFRRSLPPDEGLMFAYGRESTTETAIHMFFMFMPIAVIWLDGDGVVVDKKLARPWRPLYAPSRPARYVIEAPPRLLEKVEVGDRLEFE